MATSFAGLDATKDLIEISLRPAGELWRASTCDESINEISEKLSSLRPELVVMQANGGFELPVAGVLATVGLPFALIHPRHIREFARAIGRLSRVELTFAALLAQYAETVRPEPWPLPEELVQQLRDLRARRREIQQMVLLERRRVNEAPQVVQKNHQSHLLFLEKSLSSLDEQFNWTVRSSRVWR